MKDVELLLEKLFDYYNVSSVAELARTIDTDQKRISNWKTRNSVSAVKKRIRELGIYNDIFGDVNTQSIGIISGGQVAQTVSGDQKQETLTKTESDKIDPATFNLFKEAYVKAIDNDDIKGLRIHLMDY